jgi:formylglycine-generating enzyme required for sulfatase activity
VTDFPRFALENEWYKAAHYQPATEGGDADDYWLYPTATNTQPVLAAATPTGDIANPGVNVANYAEGADWNGQNGNVTTVGTAGSASRSYYGTADQAGNVWEWNEAVVGGTQRGNRGGSLSNILATLQSSNRGSDPPTWEARGQGFRIASPAQTAPIPAASQWSMLVFALAVLIAATRLIRPVAA